MLTGNDCQNVGRAVTAAAATVDAAAAEVDAECAREVYGEDSLWKIRCGG